jgi:crotonobetainyl-CoA:carnitine CoA-transferase CaiB-like acyl-CoA transferase
LFLAAPSEREWRAFIAAAGREDLADDQRFRDVGARADHAADLVEVLSDLFFTRTAADWEEVMTASDVACVEVVKGPSHAVLMDENGLGRQLGMIVDVPHEILGSSRLSGV